MFKKLSKYLLKYSAFIISILGLIYIWHFTANRYEVTSEFSVVVENDSNAKASMGLLNLISGGSNSKTETQVTLAFIHSSDMLLDLEKEFSLQQHYSSPPHDYLYRLNPTDKIDDRLIYYRKHIKASVDPKTGLIKLSVTSFSPQLSYKISKSILKKTELFINQINHNIANKRLIFAKKELNRAQENFRKKRNALLNFQNTHQIIQPKAIIKAQLAAIQQLQLHKIDKEIQLATIRATSPQSPLISKSEIAIQKLNKEIKLQKEALSGNHQNKLNQLLAEYENLQLDLEFSTKLKAGAELILEKTNSETMAHSIFFSIIQNPYLPEEKIHPRRIYLSCTFVTVVFLLQYILNALIKSIYDRV